MARAKVWLDVHGTDLHRYGDIDGAAATTGMISDETDL
jgi:hypothetical protein